MTMTRFIDVLEVLQVKLQDAQARYARTVNSAELLAEHGTAGRFVYIPETGGNQIPLEVADATRELLLQQAGAQSVNAVVLELNNLWQQVRAVADDAVQHIEAASNAAITQVATAQPAQSPPQRVTPRQPVTTPPTEAVTMTQAVTPPPRVRRI